MSRPQTGIEIGFGLTSRCVRCGADRELEGRKVLQHESTIIARSEQPCECGERRIKVVWALEVEG